MYRLFISSFFVFTILANTVYSQRPGNKELPSIGKISGLVLDMESGEPLEFVTVSIYSQRDSSLLTGGITDIKGKFLIEEIRLGRLYLKFSYIGYDDQFMDGIILSPRNGNSIEKDLGELRLVPNTQVLDAVEVTANNGFVGNGIDRKIYRLDQLQVAEGGSVIEVMENIPSVDVDIDGNISLRGSENVTVLVDGKPSALTGADRRAILEHIPAANIERVEVITNPSAKYDPDGMAGIINIVTKKNKLEGFNGSVTANIGNRHKYSFSGLLNYKIKKWNIYTSYSFNYRERFFEGTNYRETVFNDSLSILRQESNSDRISRSHLVKVGIDFSPNLTNTLSISTMYNFRGGNTSENIVYHDYDEEDILSGYRNRDIKETTAGDSWDFNFNYQKDFKKPRQKLSLDLNYSLSGSDYTGHFVEQPFNPDHTIVDPNPFIQNNFNIGKNYIGTGELSYLHPFSEKGNLDLGIKSTSRTIETDFISETYDSVSQDYMPDVDISNKFTYNEQIHAGYAVYQQYIDKFGFQLGIRAEQAYTDFDLLTTGQQYKNDYFNLFPSVHLSYKFSEKQEMKLSYSRRINRPRVRSLNPFTDLSDPQNIRIGNPYLEPEYINAYELEFGQYWDRYSITASIYYRDINNMISRLKTVDTNGISILTWGNLSSGKSFGLELIINGELAKWWNFTLSGNIYKTELDGSNLEADLNNEGYGFTSKLLTTIKWNKVFDIQLSARYMGPRPITQGEIKEIFMADLALSKKVLKNKGTLNLRFSDIFNTRKFRFQTSGINFYQEGMRNRESQNIYLSFTYRFGKLKDSRQGRKRGSNGNGSFEDVGID